MKLKIIFFLCIFVFAGTSTKAQFRIETEGYVQDFPIIQILPRDFSRIFNIPQTLLMNYTRLRIKPSIFLSNSAWLKIEVESDLLIYKYLSNVIVFSGEKTDRQLLNLKWLVKNNKNLLMLNFIDRFYIRKIFSFGRITIGRQRIAWGTGRIWNPTDLFNPINPTSFYKIEKDGADAISARITLGNFSDLNLVFNPLEKLNQSNYGLRLRSNYGLFDFSLMTGKFDGGLVAGADFAGNINDAGIRGEALYSFRSGNSPSFFKYILGIDYQFTPKIYGLLEFHFNGQGKKDKYRYEFNKLIKGKIINMGRLYVAASFSYEATPLLTLTLTNINNLKDESGFVFVSGNYSLTENSYLNAGVQLFYGSSFSEYWYYPNSFYFEWEFYF